VNSTLRLNVLIYPNNLKHLLARSVSGLGLKTGKFPNVVENVGHFQEVFGFNSC
jgi:hypothetical protein